MKAEEEVKAISDRFGGTNNNNRKKRKKAFMIRDILSDDSFEDEKESALDLSSNKTASNQQSDQLRDKLPAWIFCTRYSDRPSAGKHTEY